MKKDIIVAGLHKLRVAHARRFNYDLDAMFEDSCRKQVRRSVVDLKPIKPALPRVAEPYATDGTDEAQKASKAAR